ncbi:DEAD/DEAH box helicase [Alloalcanivorax xenomutans]|jgi:ATP-dependent RNA helicase RhlE|uniref:ATP-dependent RNA helicase RhlE n=2 Tax=Alloalcanivorax xenomutans TaxID=1094342 RepID=A0A9Q3W9V9_9GAMM|nr:DEAD/DEAH box helicase [Alloalcanivorax xenomutans]ARB46588.1 ATP-dependent RNA helicase RhlE [Alloalcanivorax xenomutans]MCE7510983.1 DEAD/DEAH box helicase [Alloalcanivorax xenomutans]MCE7525371.1 DEAD/DEAH box helicase [Alloalcanivorax xenomutans]WOA30314.1 DEAD/DEAH box helicase [Alloalcanivorax xenomutans]WOD27202.1 DEAD/DEAH box helicase [Alloalcanivorax xenomutans]
MDFQSLGLIDPLLRAVAEQGYDRPSPIQAQAIPAVLGGSDVMAAAQTGTGKTAGFTLPLLQRLEPGKPAASRQVRALVLTPTRELAAQVGESVAEYGKYLPALRSAVVFGGVNINPQINRLRGGVDVLVATPGRLLDLYQQKAMSFDQLEILVLDEADRMLDMGFIHDIRKVLRLLPKQRQTLMFSATFSNEIRTLAKTLVRSPKEIDISPRNSTAERVRQWVVTVDKRHKAALLTHLIGEQQWFQVLVFTRTKHGANRLAKQLESAGIEAVAIHGNKSQNARTRALAGFKSGDVRALVATDIAARGLDIDQLPQVVNFDLPNVAEDYVHRIGRTGRAGADGEAVSLVSGEDQKLLKGIERLIKQPIERRQVTNFEPPAVADIPDEREPRSRPNGSRSGSRSGPRSDGASPNKSGQRRSAPRGADGKPAPRRRRRGGGGGGGGQRSGNGGNRASRG